MITQSSLLIRTAACALVMLVALPLGTARAEDTLLPELSHTSAWKTEDASLPVTEANDRLVINLDKLTQATPARLLLKTPLPIPAGSEFMYQAAMDRIYELFLYPVVRDSTGTDYLMHAYSAGTVKEGLFIGGRFRGGLERVGEVRMRTRGTRAIYQQHFDRADGKNGRPLGQMTLIGFELRGKQAEGKANTLYLRNFRITDIARESSALYYQINDQECFGEIDGTPSIAFGDLGVDQEKTLAIDWEARREYVGQPFLSGSSNFEATDTKETPMAVQLARRIEFPITTPGTYWIRVKTRTGDLSTSAPKRILEKEYRLYVIKGTEQPKDKDGTPAPVSQASIRVAPERKELIWTADEKWEVPIHFAGAAGKQVEIRVTDRAENVLAEKRETLDSLKSTSSSPTSPESSSNATVTLDLSSVRPGAYDLSITVLQDGKPVDSITRLIGKRFAPATAAAPTTPASFTLPPGVPTARQIIDGPRPLFHLMPHIGVRQKELEKIKAMMDVCVPTSRDFEYQMNWADAEPLPGVYDFSELDAVLDYAKQKGISVLVWPDFAPPEWLPSHYTMNAKGDIFGHESYLFHGARLNKFHSPGIRQSMVDLLRNTALHARNHPALQGYYYLVEHPGDAPYVGWYEGFDSFTLSGFRERAEKLYGTVAKANEAWRSSFQDFASAMPPAETEKDASPRLLLDWLRFRKESIHDFLVDCAKAVRESDPHRLIMVYGDGIIAERMDEFARLNMMTANGGCDRPETFVVGKVQVTDAGIPQRAEEVTVTQWAAKYPTRLDTSFFTMMLGGGSNSCCKMFVSVDTFLRSPSKNFDALRKSPFALDRYEKFQPLWTELRPARLVGAGQVRLYLNTNSQLLRHKSPGAGGGADPYASMLFLDSQVPVGVAPGKNWQRDTKLLVMPENLLHTMEKSAVNDVAAYVENGGALLMNADTGRVCVDDPDADWYLLKRFGFRPPANAEAINAYAKVGGAPGSPMEGRANIASIRHVWNAGEQPGTTLAVFSDRQNQPAMTVAPYGKGKVFVLWASEVQPPGKNGDKDYPMLRSLAEMCGAELHMEADSRVFWTNLLQSPTGQHYLLVMHSNYDAAPEKSCTVRLPRFPDGDYQITELISGKTVADKTPAQKLRTEGLRVALGLREVAVYRLEKK